MRQEMKYYKIFITALVAVMLGLSPVANAAKKGNWKNGRIYFKMVCSECHAKEAGGKISPAEKTKAEWTAYFEKNIHGPQDAPTKYTASYFVSKDYRESIKDTNRAAKKMLKVPEDQLLEDVKAYLLHTAKDSDQPTTCD